MRRRKEEKGNASFSRTLYLAKCCTDSIDHSRWETDKVTHNLNPSGKLPKFSGLLCRNISNFDAELYLVSLRELQSMDPQQRLLLDIVGESLGVNLINFNNEHCATKTIRSPGTSVVLGISWVDFQNVSTFLEWRAQLTRRVHHLWLPYVLELIQYGSKTQTALSLGR
jgi:hypothetical protein